MRPFYWQGTRNFGDYLNSWLWPRLLPDCLSEDSSVRLIGVGSLLKSSLNRLEGRKIIFGTGSGYGSIPAAEHYRDWEFYFVRGPLTAKCFGLSAETGIVDGAWLLGLLPEARGFGSDRRGVTFIPHWTTGETGDWARPCAMAGLDYVDPQGDLEEILGRIASSELVVTESLHGAILADLFRVPWIPVRISPKFLPFKWQDWFQSMELEGRMRSLPLSDLFEYFYNRTSPGRPDYSVASESIPECQLSEERERPASPGAWYRYCSGAKGRLRSLRRGVLDACKGIRGVYPLSVWNGRHQEQLAESLRKLSKSDPFLSNDVVHARKLDQLRDVTERLRQNWRTPLRNQVR